MKVAIAACLVTSLLPISVAKAEKPVSACTTALDLKSSAKSRAVGSTIREAGRLMEAGEAAEACSSLSNALVHIEQKRAAFIACYRETRNNPDEAARGAADEAIKFATTMQKLESNLATLMTQAHC